MAQNFEFTIKDAYENMDFKAVTAMLTYAYWSPGIGQAEVEQGARNSALVVGAFDPAGKQIGYARVVSDKTRFAYLMDLIVHESRRRKGIGRAMVNHIMAHSSLKGVYQWVLKTKDAQGVYEKLGFGPLAHPEYWMERRHGRPKR